MRDPSPGQESQSATSTSFVGRKSILVTRVTSTRKRCKHTGEPGLQFGVGEPQVPGDQDPLDLVGSLPDLQDLGVPVVPGHGELFDVSVRAVDLEGLPGA